MKYISLKLIRFYQSTLSFDHGPMSKFFPYGFCRFHPTCSEYAYQAIDKYGVAKGILMGFIRIIRCNPFTKGGYDPIK